MVTLGMTPRSSKYVCKETFNSFTSSGLASLSKAVSKARTGLDPLISAISFKTPSIPPLSLLKAETSFLWCGIRVLRSSSKCQNLDVTPLEQTSLFDWKIQMWSPRYKEDKVEDFVSDLIGIISYCVPGERCNRRRIRQHCCRGGKQNNPGKGGICIISWKIREVKQRNKKSCGANHNASCSFE